MKWLSIGVNPPPLDTEIIIKKIDQLLWCKHTQLDCKAIRLSSKIFNEDEAAMSLLTDGYAQWSTTE